MTETATLLVFCKRPKLNQGKQRIAETLGPENALILANALLECALEDARNWQGPVVLSPSESSEIEWAKSLMPRAQVVAQPAGNLGERLESVDSLLRQKGHEHILIIGTDAPILSKEFYTAADEALQSSDMVLSSASDGGVTIMAASCAWPNMTDLPWSSTQLNEALKARCEEKGLKVSYIQPSYDIDLEGDLQKLLIDLDDDVRPARQRLLQLSKKIIEKDRCYA